jgi:HPt (histidine-containing phosphotransfer) domain-containing protein
MPFDNLRNPDGSVLDYAEAVQRLDGQPELFGIVASVFVEDCPKNLEAIRDALSLGDTEAVAFGAHKIKGALSALAAHSARAAAVQLEVFGREGQLGKAREHYPVLEQRVSALIPVLNGLILAECR